MTEPEDDEMTRFTENRRRIDIVNEHAAVQEEILAHQERAFAAERRRTNHRLLFTFLATTAIFLLLGWRSEVNNASTETNTHRIAENTWLNCEQGAGRATAINRTYQLLAGQLAALTPQTKGLAVLVDIYRHAALPIPVCGAKP